MKDNRKSTLSDTLAIAGTTSCSMQSRASGHLDLCPVLHQGGWILMIHQTYIMWTSSGTLVRAWSLWSCLQSQVCESQKRPNTNANARAVRRLKCERGGRGRAGSTDPGRRGAFSIALKVAWWRLGVGVVMGISSVAPPYVVRASLAADKCAQSSTDSHTLSKTS